MISVDMPDYSLNYSSEWNKGTDKQAEFVVYSPLSGAEDTFSENFNILKQNLKESGFNTMHAFDSISEFQIINAFGLKAIIESETEGNHHKLIYKGALKGQKLKWKQMYYLKNETAYILTYTAEENQFDKYSDVAESIFNSFKLK